MRSKTSEFIYQLPIERLIARINQYFGNTQRPDNLLVADGLGDDYGRERINEAFGKLPWNEIPQICIVGEFDSADLSHHLSVRGFVYYLPAFLRTLLQARNFGWFEKLLIPPFDRLEDVAIYFGDGNLFPYETHFVERQRSRIQYAFQNFNEKQRACVADYIQIAESYETEDPTPEFTALLRKYTDFWRHGSIKSS